MKRSQLLVFALLLTLLGSGIASAETATQKTLVVRSDEQIVTDVVARLTRIGQSYTFNSVYVKSEGGNVVLTGKVRDAHLKERAFEEASKVQGVRSVQDHIDVLPISAFDDRIRIAAYRRLRNDGALFHYFLGRDPSINIIVENSRVTLVGAVNSKVDKVRAASPIRELSGVLSVDNQLQVVRG